ncbi:condensation domain-containing protein [Actinoplanes sp. NPDC004185]
MTGPTLWSGPDTTTGPTISGGFALSSQQRFLHLVDKSDGFGPFGPRYTIVGGWRLTGAVDDGRLRAALGDVIDRHEALRTTIVRDTAGAGQLTHDQVAPDLTVLSLAGGSPQGRDRRAEELLNETEAQELQPSRVPVLRAVLARFDGDDAVLVLAAHHTAVDGWSIQVVVRDLAACYAARAAGSTPQLPAVRQYRDYVRWQQQSADEPQVARARRFWRDNLAGAQVTPLRMDLPRSLQTPGTTAWHRYESGAGVQDSVRAYAAAQRSSPFMVMLAAYLLHLRENTGTDDVVVPTFGAGRRPAWTAEMVGSFFNMLPLRVHLGGCRDFAAVVARVRAQCLAAYTHELPFLDILHEAPELMRAAADEWHASCVFQLVQSPYIAVGERVGDIGYRAMRRRLLSQARGSQIPDGALWAIEFDAQGRTFGSIGYGRGQFRQQSIDDLVNGYNRTLARLLDNPGRL